MKKSMVYTLIAAALLLTCTIGIASTSSDRPEEHIPATEHKGTPSPATLLLFGSSMVCLLSFTKFRNQ